MKSRLEEVSKTVTTINLIGVAFETVAEKKKTETMTVTPINLVGVAFKTVAKKKNTAIMTMNLRTHGSKTQEYKKAYAVWHIIHPSTFVHKKKQNPPMSTYNTKHHLIEYKIGNLIILPTIIKSGMIP
jgi:hypothetical protein